MSYSVSALRCSPSGSLSSLSLSAVDTNSSNLVANSEILDQILELQSRVDDQAIKIEISRLMTALLTSLAKGGEIALVDEQTQGCIETWVRDSRVLVCPMTLIGLGGQHEMLLAEGVLALALVAKRNAKGEYTSPTYRHACRSRNSR